VCTPRAQLTVSLRKGEIVSFSKMMFCASFSQQWQQVTMLQPGRRIFPEPNFSCFILLGAEPQTHGPAPK
jgi:hypothetical protein